MSAAVGGGGGGGGGGGRIRVLVTGGCGFLGKHLIRELAACPEVGAIVALDVRPLPDGFRLDCSDGTTLEFVEADIRDLAKLVDAFGNVQCVMHTAAVIQLGTQPDLQLMADVNVQGTANVIAACRACGVGCLVFTSTSEMGRSELPVENWNEDRIDAAAAAAAAAAASSPTGGACLLEGYAGSKRAAERLVLLANGYGLADPLTVAIRPVGIYGDGDDKYVSTILRVGKRCRGLLPHLGSREARVQRVYVGNVAWAHVCAMRCLLRLRRRRSLREERQLQQQQQEEEAEEEEAVQNEEEDEEEAAEDSNVAGRAFLVTDDTPLSSNFQFARRFLAPHGVRLLNVEVPLSLLLLLWRLLELLARLLAPLCRLPLPFSSSELIMACTTCHYDASRIRRRLGYSPLYDTDECMRRSAAYYASLQL